MTGKGNGRVYDTIVIGSGFGGAMIAHELVHAGEDVLMIERGDWVARGPQNRRPNQLVFLSSAYQTESPYHVLSDDGWGVQGSLSCVGGPSVYYGAASFRFREQDFRTNADLSLDSGAEWPYGYEALEPYYARAEQLLGVAGEAAVDPTEPWRSTSYTQRLSATSQQSRRIERAARDLGLNPFRIPLAISFGESEKRGMESGPPERPRCDSCSMCDGFACAVGAKNDLATGVLPDLLRNGLTLQANTVAIRLVTRDRRVECVECVDRSCGAPRFFHSRRVVLAAGAIASAHLLLASRMEAMNPAGHVVGRYLMRHCNAAVLGYLPGSTTESTRFHKQIGVHDFYFGVDGAGKLGSIQQMADAPRAMLRSRLPGVVHAAAEPALACLTGLMVIAEDQPQSGNRVMVDHTHVDAVGLPRVVIAHRYSSRDRAARGALVAQAKRILRAAGARLPLAFRIKSFSHAVGTVRMGSDPATSPLDEHCAFRGVDNLSVVDGSFMPTSAGVNPSLTIAANALRVGAHLTGEEVASQATRSRALAAR